MVGLVSGTGWWEWEVKLCGGTGWLDYVVGLGSGIGWWDWEVRLDGAIYKLCRDVRHLDLDSLINVVMVHFEIRISEFQLDSVRKLGSQR